MGIRGTFMLLLSMVLGLCPDLHAQPASGWGEGMPFYHYYPPKAYGGEAQNWEMVQDDRGLLYVANTGGVLQFDGLNWRMIEIANGASALSLAIQDSQRVYVGSTSEIGYLAPDSLGRMQYVSLTPLVPEAHKPFHYVRQVRVVGENVIFQDSERLFVYDGKDIEVIKPDYPMQQFNFVVDDRLYLVLGELGLCRLDGKYLTPLDGGKAFSSLKFSGSLPLDEGRWLIGSWNQGLFVFQNDSLKPFSTPVTDFLAQNILYRLERLSNGSIALGTIEGGVAVIDQKGNWVSTLSKQSGLPSSTVISLFSDLEGKLWVGTSNGLVHFSYPSPFSHFWENEGLIGTVNSLRFYGSSLLAGTSQGVFELKAGENPGDPAFFEKWPAAGIDVFDLLPLEGGLLLGDDAGLAWISQGRRQGLSGRFVQVLYSSSWLPNLVFIGFQDGLGYIRISQGEVVEFGEIPGIAVEVRSLAEDHQGILWAGTLYDGIKRIDLSAGLSSPQISHLGVADGLSNEKDTEVFGAGNKVFFSTMESLYRFDSGRNRFIPDSSLGSQFTDGSRWVYRMAYQPERNEYWIHSYNLSETVLLKAKADSFRLQKDPFQRINDFQIYTILPDTSGVTWFGGPEGVVRYDPGAFRPGGKQLPALIRKVTAGRDSLLSGGDGLLKSRDFALPYEFNALRFEYSAAFLEAPEATRYQYKLDGFEKEWSEWTSEAIRVYTNLSEGSYTFQVRAKNLYGQLSKVASFSFRIYPPWYRTLWFLGLSSIFGLASLVMGVRYVATRKLIRRVEELELREKVQRERERISRDLHDNVGSQLTLIINNLDVISYKTRKSDPESIRKALEKVGESARQTMQQLRETIWAIKQERFSAEEFAARVRDFLRNSLSELHAPLSWEVKLEGDPSRLLGPSQVLNLFRIVQEATQNAVKHAEADKLHISLDLSRREMLLLRIEDNGIGMDLQAARAKKGHYGLKNMVLRTEEIGGDLTFDTRQDQGVRIEVQVPLGFSAPKA